MPKWTDYQKAVIDHKGTNLLVSAAAGSGKTAVMIEHIFNAVVFDKISIDKILVSTFTNAAAASMKEKLNNKFDSAILEDPNNIYLIRQKQLIDRANISTIHAFCIKMLKKYYFRTPLPPDFRIFEKSQVNMLSSVALGDAIEECAKLYNDGLFPEYNDALIQFGDIKNDLTLATVILELDKLLSRLPHPEVFKEKTLKYFNDTTFYSNFLLTECRNLLRDAVKHAEKIMEEFFDTPIKDTANNLMDFYIQWLESAIDAPDIESLNQCITTRPRKAPSVSKGPLSESLKTYSTELIKRIMTEVANMTADIKETDLSFLLPAVKGLFRLHEAYQEKLNALMIAEGGTDFNGLLKHMAKLLEENEDIRQDLENNISLIYFDEYQDVNAFQEYIISKISNGNNMFFVGDIKQSIYGFQDARPELFREKMELYDNTDKGDRLNLKNNFRSYPEILEGVNFIFKKLICKKDISEIVYDEDSYLYPSPEADSPQFSSCLYLDENKEPANELIITEGKKTDEAYAIGLKIQELLKTTIIEDGKKRNVRYGDIVILARKTNAGARFTSVFKEMGIPYSQQEKEEEDNSDTTVTITSLLRLLTLRRNDMDLITVMLSPMGGFTPTQLGTVRAQNKETSFYDALKRYEGPLKKKIDDFFKLLDDLELVEKSMSLADFIEYVANETGYLYHTAYLPKNSKEVQALKRLIDGARAFSDFSDKGILGFLEYYKSVSAPKDNQFTMDKNDNSVHFMTIHHSKGLEFPIVILSGCTDTGKGHDDTVLLNEKMGIGFDYNVTDDFSVRSLEKSVARTAIDYAMKKLDVAEELRILYVALTRAKSKLIVSICAGKSYIAKRSIPLTDGVIKTSRHYADLLLPLFFYHKNCDDFRFFIDEDRIIPSARLHSESFWKVTVNSGLTPDFEEKDTITDEIFDKEEYLKKVKESFSWMYPYAAATLQRTKQSPSKKQIRTKIPLRKPMFDDKEYKGAQKGTVVHFFMEHVSFLSEKNARQQAEEMLYQGILTKEEFDALPFENLEKFMTSPFALRMKNSELVCRERSFCHIIPFDETGDESLVQGIIDCYFFEDDHIVLLDYKTDFINNDLDEHILHHTPQLKMYKAALEQLYPGKKVYPYVHFFHVDKTVEIL